MLVNFLSTELVIKIGICIPQGRDRAELRKPALWTVFILKSIRLRLGSLGTFHLHLCIPSSTLSLGWRKPSSSHVPHAFSPSVIPSISCIPVHSFSSEYDLSQFLFRPQVCFYLLPSLLPYTSFTETIYASSLPSYSSILQNIFFPSSHH